MTTYRRRPVVVQAIQWTGDNLDEVREWLGEGWKLHLTPDLPDRICVHVLGESHTGWFIPTDYLVRDERGAVRRVSAEEFERAYEEVEA